VVEAYNTRTAAAVGLGELGLLHPHELCCSLLLPDLQQAAALQLLLLLGLLVLSNNCEIRTAAPKASRGAPSHTAGKSQLDSPASILWQKPLLGKVQITPA
jgi:hypothetical protein